jgi:hypothetical protein
MSLGEFNRNEAVRFFVTMDTAPTGTPTITIEKNGASILAATAMTQGLSNLEWYYDYTIDGAAAVGAYQVRYTAVIDGVTRYVPEAYNVSINNADDLATDIAAVPTVEEIDTELSDNHTSGAWGSGGGGAYNATINVKDQDTNNVANAVVTIHNSNDDDPIIAAGTTDAQGDVTLNIEGNVYVRVSKVGFTFDSTAKNITASATYNVTGTAISYSEPASVDLCRLFLYPVTLGGADITDLATTFYISSQGKLTKVDGAFIENTTLNFTYNDATTPDSYYFDAVQGSTVFIKCKALGITAEITVPALATQDLYDLIT